MESALLICPTELSAGFQHRHHCRAKQAIIPHASERRQIYIEELFNVEELLSLVPVHPITRQTGWLVGRIEGQEAATGNILTFNDLMIAAAALEQNYAVLTSNVRNFRKIPNLIVVRF